MNANTKKILMTAVVALVAVAIVNRVAVARNIVYGAQS